FAGFALLFAVERGLLGCCLGGLNASGALFVAAAHGVEFHLANVFGQAFVGSAGGGLQVLDGVHTAQFIERVGSHGGGRLVLAVEGLPDGLFLILAIKGRGQQLGGAGGAVENRVFGQGKGI